MYKVPDLAFIYIAKHVTIPYSEKKSGFLVSCFCIKSARTSLDDGDSESPEMLDDSQALPMRAAQGPARHVEGPGKSMTATNDYYRGHLGSNSSNGSIPHHPSVPKAQPRHWSIRAKEIKNILDSVGIEADDDWLNKVISELNRKNIEDVIAQGISKLASVPAGGAVAVSAAPGSATPAVGSAPAIADEKKEEKKEESEGCVADGQVLQAADAIVKRLTATMAELGLRRKQRPMAEVPAQGQNEAPPTEKPKVVMTHLWDMIILSKMAGSYSGKTFTGVETKPEMIGHCAGRFSMTYQPDIFKQKDIL
ncbi:hypothetical protein Celaphus_00010090 [Cervus elaphus hippelaphus]|uniref:Large ribosomal subunit protein P2 n=1 Tax=Cervus elaphus hippelaphus TaxID=46360 RepID=A0A212C1E3_CEREH|nr:hypothetical protein Celaphus_00010090 [Cervus elaphus hippelaphus]